jgi:transposase
MNECTHIGLDVHKDTIAVAVLRPGTTDVDERVIPNTPEAIRRLLARHDPTATHLCYEAGPTGYDTHRLVAALGYGCDVIAPSLIPRRSGSRVKTDRIDARNLARLNRAGELTSVRVPGAAEEAVRDLIRVREEVKCDRRVARQRIRSFLLRYGKHYPGPRDAWSHRFEVWARSVTFDEPLATEAFKNLTAAYFIRDTQLAEMGRRIEEIAATEPFAEGVARLSALRGIGTLSAMTILAETCDFHRFGDAGSYMAFTGHDRQSGTRAIGHVMHAGGRHIPERSSITLCDSSKRASSLRQAPVRPRCEVEIPGYQHGRAPNPCARPLAPTKNQRGP